MNEAYIYGLFDPRDGELRYVGKAVNPTTRLRDHMKEARLKPGSHRRHWLRELLAAKLTPTVRVLEVTDTENWSEAERRNIDLARVVGCRLVNGTDGGEGSLGYRTSEETKAKLRAAHLGKRLSPEARAKFIAAGRMAALGRPRNHSEATRAKMSASQKRFYRVTSAPPRGAIAMLRDPATRESVLARMRLRAQSRNPETGRFLAQKEN